MGKARPGPPDDSNVGKRRRQQSAENSEGDEDTLLKQNPFASLVTNPQDQSNCSTVNLSDGSGRKKQPPLVVKNVNFSTLSTGIAECGVNPVYKLTRFGIKVLCNSSQEFNQVQDHLKMCSYEYYTHDKPGERPYRVIIRGLPLAEPGILQSQLESEYGLEAQAVHVIRRKEESEPFYLVHFLKGSTTLKKLREIKHIGSIIVQWQAYRNNRADVTQCLNCLHHGHGTRNCHLKSRCNHCGDAHTSDQCPKKSESTKHCANCDGAHSATDPSVQNTYGLDSKRQNQINRGGSPPIKGQQHQL
ncbi:uncharacterized protein LOC129729309 [Wyeomyia smithii]|uniref:uncharacterized protein LOC129729309 n=1 Tax=Wyeomyia smithii TaxID=174621 RepID=UPI0024682072|nr:uncharacterized protein LOC129729309 [Wyeomyia smithii]